MTAAEKINWARMRELANEVSRLQAEGSWNVEAFARVNAEAAKASGGLPGARDWLLQEADPSWLELAAPVA